MTTTPTAPADSQLERQRQRRGFWLRTLHQWHWISSAVCLVGMLLFAVTGITLNHAGQIESVATVENRMVDLPDELRETLEAVTEEGEAPLPAELARWLSAQLSISIGRRQAEWSEDEVYLSMPRPGADAWLSIDRASGAVEFEITRRGWISYFNDLHKGRNAGPAWSWFLDLFAIATLVFCLTGLFLLYIHARQRRLTWPLVGLGIVIPALLALLFIH